MLLESLLLSDVTSLLLCSIEVIFKAEPWFINFSSCRQACICSMLTVISQETILRLIEISPSTDVTLICSSCLDEEFDIIMDSLSVSLKKHYEMSGA